MKQLDDLVREFEAEDPSGMAEARDWVKRVAESIKRDPHQLVIRDLTRWAEEAKR